MASNSIEAEHLPDMEVSDHASSPRARDSTSDVQPPTTHASKNLKRSSTGMMDILSLSSRSESKLVDYAAGFEPRSLGHDSWGPTTSNPQTALQTVRKNENSKASHLFRKFKMNQVDGENSRQQESQTPSMLLKLSTEIRQIIYGMVFRDLEIIHVWGDLASPIYNHKFSTSLMLTCKQLAYESSSFLYSSRVFWAFLSTHPGRDCIKLKFLLLIRNLVVEGESEKSSLRWADKAIKTIRILSEMRVHLTSLTIIIAPDLHKTTELHEGVLRYRYCTKFADWFSARCSVHKGHSVLQAVLDSYCSVFNLIIVLPDGQRLVASFDMRRLIREKDNLDDIDPDTMRRMSQEDADLFKELRMLSYTIEAVSINPAGAIEAGKVRPLEKWEKVQDGLKLLKRSADPALPKPTEVTTLISPQVYKFDTKRWRCGEGSISGRGSGMGCPL